MIRFVFLALFMKGCVCLYPSHGNVIELTPSNFDKLVLKSDEVWVVEFFAPWCGHCQNLVPEYTAAANALKGVVKVGAINVDTYKDLGSRYDVHGFPTIKIFGANKSKPEDYSGRRTAKEIAEAGLKAARLKVKNALDGGHSSGGSSDVSITADDKDVIELTDSNFKRLVIDSDDMWLVEFYAPWCGHCKNLAPHWAKAATELKGKVKLGALDATVHQVMSQKYGIQGFPTIKLFAPNSKDAPENYDGGRTASDIVSWALDKLSENIPPPEVIEVVDEKSFMSVCENKPLCVISVLPHLLDCQSKCRNDYLELLKTVGEKFKKKMWGWAWLEAGCQTELESALDIGGFGYPAMAVVNPKKMKYSILRGAFSKDGLYEFLRDLSFGKGNTAPVKQGKWPSFNTCNAWDGKDAEEPVVDDIDLSDVDLDEKDEL
nr:unnamed protein product [Callosobruchus analis]